MHVCCDPMQNRAYRWFLVTAGPDVKTSPIGATIDVGFHWVQQPITSDTEAVVQ